VDEDGGRSSEELSWDDLNAGSVDMIWLPLLFVILAAFFRFLYPVF
jgi:hypothetical protein